MLKNTCYTIGHSNLPFEKFLELLKTFDIDCVVDARSIPYSKYAKQFNKKNIDNELSNHNIRYIFMGDLIGAKIDDEEYFTNGKVDFDKISNKKEFREGISRVIHGIKKNYTIAVMCSEKDPLKCHRYHLIARELHKSGISVLHILQNGEIYEQE